MEIEQAFIALPMSDGTTSIMGFITQGRGDRLPVGAEWISEGWWRREATTANINDELGRTFGPLADPKPLSFHIVERADIPVDRTYRNALRHDGSAFSHDMEHARRLHLDIVRQERNAQFPALDVAWMKAMGQGDTKAAAEVEAQRQALRDLPKTLGTAIEAARTTDELKLVAG